MKKKDESGRLKKRGKQERLSRAELEALAFLLGLGRTSVRRKHIESDTKLPLTLSEEERKLISTTWSISGGLTDAQLRALERAPKPELHLTLGDWDELAGWVAATANHARNGSRLKNRADAFFGRIQDLLDSYTDE